MSTLPPVKETPPDLAFAPKRILVPIDGSANSKRALEAAIRLVKDYHASLIIVNIIPIQKFVVESGVGFGAPEEYYQMAEEDSKKLVSGGVSVAERNGVSDVRGETVRGPESIVSSIIGYAEQEKADLIVIGTRGLGGFKKMHLGSVSNGVVAHSHCNVMVIR